MKRIMRRPRAAIGVLLAVIALAASAIPAAAAAPIDCTIGGGSRADVLIGTGRADVICGRGGGDRLLGRGADDRLYGKAGADRLNGEAGDDVLVGGVGGDVLRSRDGVRGNDSAYGGAGHDTCIVDLDDRVRKCETVLVSVPMFRSVCEAHGGAYSPSGDTLNHGTLSPLCEWDGISFEAFFEAEADLALLCRRDYTWASGSDPDYIGCSLPN
jgi:hypothetical protein